MPRSLRDRLGRSKLVSLSRPASILERRGYRVLRTLGSGAYARVKLCQMPSGRQVAVKIVTKRKATDGYVEKFLPREIAALELLNHDHVIKLHETLEDADRVYLVMDYAENGDLLDHVNKVGPLPESQARRLFRHMVGAMEHCHARGIVHRDLKCENILLAQDGSARIADFGFATLSADPLALLKTHCGSYVSSSAVPAGRPSPNNPGPGLQAYAAPEILRNEPYSGRRSDMWSLGVILFAMVVGAHRLPSPRTLGPTCSALQADYRTTTRTSRHSWLRSRCALGSRSTSRCARPEPTPPLWPST